MEQIKAAAVDYVKQDVMAENREQFSSPQVFASPNPVLLPMEEPKDSAKAKTVYESATASGVVFVPAPNDMPPQYQPSVGHNDATALSDVHAFLESFRKASILQMEEFQKASDLKADASQKTSNLKIDALQQSLEVMKVDNEAMKVDNERLKEQVETLKKEVVALRSQAVDLQGRIVEVERGYEDKDTQYMDRIRMRHVLDCGQARLARVAQVSASGDFPPQSAADWSRAWRARLPNNADNIKWLARARRLIMDCDDADTRGLPDDVLQYFIEKPSGIRTEGDRTAHPDAIGESAYKDVIERQPEDQHPLLRQVVAYSLKFHL
ncbi:hypothetical protein IW262DRAFT_1468361 [Armillaria fumosa]|nr:hypothetical protein IW262DRAFT_1468361 [Armillaria fumosa]